MKVKYCVIAAICCLCFVGGSAFAQNKSVDPTIKDQANNTTFSYYYNGRIIQLQASKNLVAIEDKGATFSAFINNYGLNRDPLSDRDPLKKNGLTLYRRPAIKSKTTQQATLSLEIETLAQTTDQVIQPVFEQGQALLIPSSEVIVGFSQDISLSEARTYFQQYLDDQGIIDITIHRKNTYILKIDNPSNGRVYKVCQFLSQLGGIDFAEPNHLVVPLRNRYLHNRLKTFSKEDMLKAYYIANISIGNYEGIIHSKGFLYLTRASGRLKLDGLPDFYQTTFHTQAYIRREWSAYFDVVHYLS